MQEIEVEFGDVLSRRVEMDLPIQVRAQVIGMGDNLTVRSIRGETLKIFDLKRLIGWPGGRSNPKRYCQVDNLHELLLSSPVVLSLGSIDSSDLQSIIASRGFRKHCSRIP